MTCLIPRCTEPRHHSLAWCAIHSGMIPAPIRGRYDYALSMVQKCSEVSGPTLERRALALRQAKDDATQAITEALAELGTGALG